MEEIKTISEILIGVTAIVSLWISVKSLKKSDWNSAMNTAPSIILRPKEIWVSARKEGEGGYGIFESGCIIKSEINFSEIIFVIKFECFNAGRGAAFNISQPASKGMKMAEFYKTPHYQTLEDEPFIIKLEISKKFDEWIKDAAKKIPVGLFINYTNDQNNIYCKSVWKANIKPLKVDCGNLEVRKVRLLNRKSGIQYSLSKNKNEI